MVIRDERRRRVTWIPLVRALLAVLSMGGSAVVLAHAGWAGVTLLLLVGFLVFYTLLGTAAVWRDDQGAVVRWAPLSRDRRFQADQLLVDLGHARGSASDPSSTSYLVYLHAPDGTVEIADMKRRRDAERLCDAIVEVVGLARKQAG